MPLLVFVGVVVLVLVGSGVALGVSTGGTRSPESQRVAAVRGFFDALVAADAARALSYAATPPVDTSMLTDEVLAANQRLSPIADVVVTPSTYDQSVEVSYTVGGKPVVDQYTTDSTTGEHKLRQVSNSVTFVLLDLHRLPLLANGVAVQGKQVELFPGSYALTTGLPYVSWGDSSRVDISVETGGTAPALEPTVTAEGRRAFLAAAKKLVSTCTARHRLDPSPGCPFGLRQPTSGPRVSESSVRWQLKGDPWKPVADPEISSFTGAGIAKASTTMSFTCTCRFSTGQRCRPQDVTNPVTFAADVTEDRLTVRLAAF